MIKVLVLADLIAASLVSVFSGILISRIGSAIGVPFSGRGEFLVLASIPFAIMCGNVLGAAYEVDICLSGTEYYERVLKGVFLAFGWFAIVGVVFDVRATRPFVLFGLPLALTLQIGARWLARCYVHLILGSANNRWRVLAISDSPRSPDILLPRYVEVVGQITFGEIDKSDSLLQSVDAIFVDGSDDLNSEKVRNLAWKADEYGVTIWLEPKSQLLRSGRLSLLPFKELNILAVGVVHLSRPARLLKRTFDSVLSLLLLICLAPIFAVVALLILVTDGRPVIFKQVRIGQDFKPFTLFKFRTFVSPPQLISTIQPDAWNKKGMKWIEGGTYTRSGKFLRKWSLDELPQFVNVLLGTMSLVGPRPRLPEELLDSPSTGRRLRARPGVTGLWQVSGRSDLSFAEADLLDVNYVDNWSLASDLVILVRTVKVVFKRHGAS